MTGPDDVQEYLQAFTVEVATVLAQVRQTVLDAAPLDAEERISYRIPTVTVDGRPLVHYAGWTAHVSVYPVPAGDDAYQQEIAEYRSGRGTLKFRLDRPVPYDLIARTVALLLAERH